MTIRQTTAAATAPTAPMPTPSRPHDDPPPASAALPAPCTDCGETITAWRFEGRCHACSVGLPARPLPPYGGGGWGRTGEWMRYMGDMGHERRIVVAHRAAQARVAVRERREESRQAARLAAYVDAHRDLLAPAALRALFVGPVVERGCAYWAREDGSAT